MSYSLYRLLLPISLLAMLGSATAEPFLKRVYHSGESIDAAPLLDPSNRYLYVRSGSKIRVIDWREDRVVASKDLRPLCDEGDPSIDRFVFDRKAPQAYVQYCNDVFVLNLEDLKLDIVKSFTNPPESRYTVFFYLQRW